MNSHLSWKQSSHLQTRAFDQTKGSQLFVLFFFSDNRENKVFGFKGGVVVTLSAVRLLEHGKVAEADKKKDEVEEKQRERRKDMAKKGEEHVPRFFR